MKTLIKIFLLLQIGITPFAVRAQQITRLKSAVFNKENGLPTQVIRQMLEDSNGILWFLSANKLQWYDGSVFRPVPYGSSVHEIPGLVFTGLIESSEKELWIFHNNGFSIYNNKTHTYTHYDKATTQLKGPVYPLAKKDEKIIVYNNNSIYTFNSKTKKITNTITQTSSVFNIMNLSCFKYNVFFTLEAKKLVAKNFITGHTQPIHYKYNENNLLIPFYAGSGKFLLFEYNALSFYDSANGHLLKKVPYPDKYNFSLLPYEVYFAQKNPSSLTVAINKEIVTIDLVNMQFAEKFHTIAGKNFINNGEFSALYYDNRGTLWAATNLHGVIKISEARSPFTLFYTGDNKSNFVKCIAVSKENNIVLTGTYGNGINVFDTTGNLIKNYPLTDTRSRQGAIVTSIAKITETKFLILVYGRDQQFIFDAYNKQLYPAQRKFNNSLNIFTPGYYAELLAGENNSLYYPSSEGMCKLTYLNNKLHFLILPSSQQVSIGNQDLYQTFNMDFRQIRERNFIAECLKKIDIPGLGPNFIAKKGGNFLIGCLRGIYEFDKEAMLVNSYTLKTGLPDEQIYAALTDNDGNIWCSHNKGISVIKSNGEIETFTIESGLQDNEFNMGAACKSSDGQMFFGGINGLNAFYPQLFKEEKDHPKIFVTGINTGNKSGDTAFWNIHNIKTPFINNRIRITFSGIGLLKAESYNYQYRIVGLENEWKDLGKTRELTLSLPPGKFTIEIAAGNSFSQSRVPSKSIDIEVVPPFYARWWFITLSVLLLAAIITLTGWYIMYRKNKKRQLERQIQKKLESERIRISRDLHDNMGAYTTALLANVDKMRLDKAATDDELDKMQTNAKNILSSLRETIWVLNNKEVTLTAFSDSFKSYCFNMLKNFEHIGFDVSEDIDNDIVLQSPQALHLNKIMQEAVQNIIKHSRATNIFYIVISKEKLEISIRDNGKGFNTASAGHGNGLDNMNWRANEAGFTLNITSLPGQGTDVKISK